jgi:hypothetical protein
MFGKNHMFKLIVAIAVVASVAFAGTHRAMAGRPFITDTLGGNGHALRHAQAPRVVKTRAACPAHVGWAFTVDDQGAPWLEPVGSTPGRDCETSSAPLTPAEWKTLTD